MSAITTSTGRRPVSGASTVVIRAASIGASTPPPGPDLHPHPAAADHDALNRAAGQVRGDLSVLAAVQAGHARAVPDGRRHGIDIHPVDDRGI
jgi:hypothetical protein